MNDFEQLSDFEKPQETQETTNLTDVSETVSGNEGYTFNIADKNNDQQLTQKEAKVLPEIDTQKEFKLADENKDKLVSFNEYMNALPEKEQSKINNAPIDNAPVNNAPIDNTPVDNTPVNEELKNRINSAISSHNVDEIANVLNEVGDTDEIVLNDTYRQLSKWNFEDLSELSKKSNNIKWKNIANAIAVDTSDKDEQKKKSREWNDFVSSVDSTYKKMNGNWKDYVSKVDSTSKILNDLSDKRISKEEVEQILYRDYVKKAKGYTEKKKVKGDTTENKPIQITEKTNVRERIIEEASRHIMEHGKSLPKELKKSVQEISAEFIPFKFEHENKAKNNSEFAKSIPNIEEGLGTDLGQAGGSSSIPNGSVMQSGFGGDSGSVGSEKISRTLQQPSSSTPGGMSLPDLPEPKFSFGGGFDGIGNFTNKKRPIKIKIPKGKKVKAMAFPDLSPDVEQHNEMEGIPNAAKLARPIIKNGLYQNKEDKVDSDIYSRVIKDIIDEYKDWENVDNVYLREIPQLDITLYYDGVSQPKIKSQGMGGKQNISTLLRSNGGREILENLYAYIEEDK